MRLGSLLLLFAVLASSSCVQQLAPALGCVGDQDCASMETCLDGTCQSEGSGQVACTLADETEICGIGSYCDEGGHCTEWPSCADAPCPSGLICNDATSVCVREPECEDCCTPGSCDDGRWCNGVEVCASASGECAPGEPPCAGAAPVCDEANRACLCGGDDDCVAPEICVDGSCSCTPDCDGVLAAKQCGDDGCGGNCGTCADEDVCNDDGLCECVPACAGLQCGSDGCDGSCGECTAPATCDDGACVCSPDCAGRECGDDGCGGSCGPACAVGTCSPSGQCNCVPECGGKECGDDGCGGDCGPCTTGACDALGTCSCTPDCSGRSCGSDGCGGSCGECGPHQQCLTSGQCQNTGVVCDVLSDTISQDEYQSRSGFLTAGFDEQYQWDSRPHRYLDNYPLTAPANKTVVIDLSSTAFDPRLYVYNVAGGACTLVASDDDSGPGLNASLAITLGNGDYHVVASTYGELHTGQYNIATSTDLCGLSVSQTVYDKCEQRVLANNCSNNPCLGSAQEFCCVTAFCRGPDGYNTGDEVTILTSEICP